MGLESVELVLAIEEEFGIEIPNDTAAQMRTVGDIYDWLQTRVAGSDPSVCLSQRVFYKLRKAFVANYRLDRASVTPSARLPGLLELRELEEGWPFLRLHMDLTIPPFKSVNKILDFGSSSRPPTMRDLAQSLITINSKTLTIDQDSKEEIWHRLVRVFIQQTGITPDEVRQEALIVQDLGIE